MITAPSVETPGAAAKTQGTPGVSILETGVVRGIAIGLVVLVLLSLAVLTFRPGGLRRQFRLMARRFRIVLVLGGAYVFGSLVIRLLFTSGPVNEWGPVALALILAVVSLFVARDPAT